MVSKLLGCRTLLSSSSPCTWRLRSSRPAGLFQSGLLGRVSGSVNMRGKPNRLGLGHLTENIMFCMENSSNRASGLTSHATKMEGSCVLLWSCQQAAFLRDQGGLRLGTRGARCSLECCRPRRLGLFFSQSCQGRVEFSFGSYSTRQPKERRPLMNTCHWPSPSPGSHRANGTPQASCLRACKCPLSCWWTNSTECRSSTLTWTARNSTRTTFTRRR
mmetsp:Transcript_4396/g.12965  ORF Transcript_4396/g.12965 Transcript_4396/m.12965 type:complete len:217 (-) Transcript_4396:451-1101(-)